MKTNDYCRATESDPEDPFRVDARGFELGARCQILGGESTEALGSITKELGGFPKAHLVGVELDGGAGGGGFPPELVEVLP